MVRSPFSRRIRVSTIVVLAGTRVSRRGGYCGIQHKTEKERWTIFSIWDTSIELHPQVTAADSGTVFSRFGNEGEGSHTHMHWPWKVGETFRFFVQKKPGKRDTTDTRYYIFDPSTKKWLHSATITSPNGGKAGVMTLGGGLSSFLENFGKKDRAIPKLALYRLWLGTSVDEMICLTRASGDGDGIWGQLHDAYFLAEGDATALDALFTQLAKEKFGRPVIGEKRQHLQPISYVRLPKKLIFALKKLPHAEAVGDTGKK